jgi:urea transport system ATP-binding protein
MLQAERLSAAYGSSRVLYDVDVNIGAGEAVALLGRNGVGKTTLLRSIMGLHPTTGGSLAFADRRLNGMSAFRRARLGIGYVPQGRGIFPHLTVAENLTVGTAAATGRSASVPAYPLDEFFPALGPLRERRGGVLSGGEQQQLALARALVGGPRLLLLDEPTEGIQPNVVQQIGDVLGRLRRDFGVAILLVEQHLDFAWALTDRYYVMQRGRVVRDGSPRSESPQDIHHLLSV